MATPTRSGVNETSITIWDLVVKRLGFGAMRITGRSVWGYPPDRNAALALLRRVVEAGVNFIDTADSYGPAVSEELIAEALHPYPPGLIIATKGGLVRPGPDRWEADCRPAHLRAACEASLKRLRLDSIDLYQLHTVDSRVPLLESVGALVDLQQQGKIRHIGLSNVKLAQLVKAREAASIVSVQNRYNLADREHDRVVDACARDGLAFLPWFPLGAGALASSGGTVDEIARRRGATAGQVALAWLLRRAPVVLPIPGTSSIAHFEENLAATRLSLSDDEFAALSR
jgi:aryl-alcohol dehydrogenase-like predicted oxidoreductase